MENNKKLNCKYREIVLAGAKEHNLPTDYIDKYLDIKCKTEDVERKNEINS